MEIFGEVNRLKSELDGLLPMKRGWQEKLDSKFRLEWNYNSNHIEGNTLTYGETELLLFFDEETGDHDPRDYDEMKAHDTAIKLIYEYAADKNRPLTETFIRQLNAVLLVKPFWKDALTPDGQRTKRLIKIGSYKETPNSVRLRNGKMFHYAAPEETPLLMNALIEFYHAQEANPGMHPVTLAALFHYRFVCIHPFDDGNGRTARLLMNYIMIRNGFPPIIVKAQNKHDYLNALNRADSGDENAFVKFIGKELMWSLVLSIKAAQGQTIEDDDDVDKEIDIWKRNLLSEDAVPYGKSAWIRYFTEEAFIPFLERLTGTMERFHDLFYTYGYLVHYPTSLVKSTSDKNDFLTEAASAITKDRVKSLKIEFRFSSLKSIDGTKVDAHAFLLLNLEDQFYSIRPLAPGHDFELKGPYDAKIAGDDRAEVIRILGRHIISQIDVYKDQLVKGKK